MAQLTCIHTIIDLLYYHQVALVYIIGLSIQNFHHVYLMLFRLPINYLPIHYLLPTTTYLIETTDTFLHFITSGGNL